MSERKLAQTSWDLVVPDKAMWEIVHGVHPAVHILPEALAKMDEFVSNFHTYVADSKERRFKDTGVALETMRQLVMHSDEKNLAILTQKLGSGMLARFRSCMDTDQ